MVGGYRHIKSEMDENNPISNIPLIFTQYRNRILEESGQKWFHSDNDPNPDSNPDPKVLSLSSSVRLDDNGSPESDVEAVAMAAIAPVPLSGPEIVNPAILFHHPDPWDSPPSPLAVEDNCDPAILAPIQESPASPAQHPVAFPPDVNPSSPLSGESDFQDRVKPEVTPDHSSQRVNLFPFENEDIQGDGKGLYDLTEFDNGEIEAPPVAIRETQTARFETVQRSPRQQTDPDLNPEDPSFVDPKTLSSAELAKLRLRNCL
jgi:hypothetical protein